MNDQNEDNVPLTLMNFQTETLAKIDSLISSKFDAFGDREGDNYTYKKRGNKEQSDVNTKVLKKIRIAQTTDDEQTAKDALSQGVQLLQFRQKLIRIADQSDSGWKTVDEYVANDVAEDSEDDKKIRKANQVAAAKLKTEKKTRQQRRHHASNTQRQPPRHETPTSLRDGRGGPKPGLCFLCGQSGHWRRECGRNLGQGAAPDRKISHTDTIGHVGRGNCYQGDTDSQCTATDSVLRSDVSTGVLKGNNPHRDPENIQVRLSPLGRLYNASGRWAEIGANNEVMQVINEGYRLPFYTEPEACVLSNNKSALKHCSFVSEEIEKLLSLGCISEVETRPRVVNPLTVADNGDKLRLVLDARFVNPHLYKRAHKFEAAPEACDMFDQGDFLVSFDLKSAYHHISICDEHKTFLGFCWCFSDTPRYFVYNVLPFGISTAGYIFTKVTRCAVKYWREAGLRVIMYLDDGICACSDFSDAVRQSRVIRDDLMSLGFLIAEEKCVWQPVRVITWLGLTWNMDEGKVYVTEKRVSKLLLVLQSACDMLDTCSTLSARMLASIIGRIISMQTGMGPEVRLRTRYMYACMLFALSWEAKVFVDEKCKGELVFWKDNLMDLNGMAIKDAGPCDVTAYTDASADGYGGYIDGDWEQIVGSWDADEAQESSTWRELEAWRRVFMTKCNSLRGKSMLWCTDNKNAVSIVDVGSAKANLQKIACDVADNCRYTGISVFPKWIPRGMNVQADSLSRQSDANDWQVDDDIFWLLDAKWGPHSVDRFACNYNTKCPVFNSLSWCPGTAGIDAFNQDWSSDNNWVVPPPKMAARCVGKMRRERASGTLVIPLWKSAGYWPLFSDAGGFKHFVCESYEFSSRKLVKGKGKNGIFGSNACFTMLALKMRP